MSVLSLVPWLSSLSEGCHTVGWIVFPLTTQTQSTVVHSVHFQTEGEIERVIERFFLQIIFKIWFKCTQCVTLMHSLMPPCWHLPWGNILKFGTNVRHLFMNSLEFSFQRSELKVTGTSEDSLLKTSYNNYNNTSLKCLTGWVIEVVVFHVQKRSEDKRTGTS